VERAALWNTLGQTLLKITCPGLPDFYQGSEFMDFRLTDPDNRQPVDFAARRRALEGLPDSPITPELVALGDPDRLKLQLTRLALRARRRNVELFLRGSYVPLEVDGPGRGRLIAFARRDAAGEMVVLVGRFLASVANPWAGTRLKGLSAARYRCVLSGAEGKGDELDLSRVLSPLPVALLERCGSTP
jgi:(1->4)-alpha-D-glucan 1-alpha-D-glucosylmutase